MAEHKTSRHKVGFTDADFKRAIERAGKLRHEPLASEVEYKAGPGLDLFVVKFTDGADARFLGDLQGLQSGTPEQLSRIEIVGGGTGLHWPDLDADIYVPALLRGIYGNKLWMAKIGQRGGSVRAQRRRERRGEWLKGGRPRRKVVAGD